jgi:hypothetical protein
MLPHQVQLLLELLSLADYVLAKHTVVRGVPGPLNTVPFSHRQRIAYGVGPVPEG